MSRPVGIVGIRSLCLRLRPGLHVLQRLEFVDDTLERRRDHCRVPELRLPQPRDKTRKGQTHTTEDRPGKHEQRQRENWDERLDGVGSCGACRAARGAIQHDGRTGGVPSVQGAPRGRSTGRGRRSTPPPLKVGSGNIADGEGTNACGLNGPEPSCCAPRHSLAAVSTKQQGCG